jgi:hypothetical protein
MSRLGRPSPHEKSRTLVGGWPGERGIWYARGVAVSAEENGGDCRVGGSWIDFGRDER